MVYMQSSIKPTEDFVKKSRRRSADLIIDEINYQRKFTPNILIDGQFKNVGNKYTIIVEPLDAILNFSHALPLFSIAVSLRDEDKKEILASVIELPTLREVFFAEKNNGAWHDSFLNSASSGGRLRVSGRNSSYTMYFSSDHYIEALKDQLIMMNSPLVSIAMVSFGRFDASIFTKISNEHIALSELIIKEAGGNIYRHNNLNIFAHEKGFNELKKILEN